MTSIHASTRHVDAAPARRSASRPDTRPARRPTSFDVDVAVVGLGDAGLPTALAHRAAGRSVVGIDASPRRLNAIRARLDDATLELTDDVARLAGAAAVIVCVPAPLDRYLVPDLTMLRAACESVVEHAVPHQLLMLTSTTYVGCTAEMLLRPVTRRGLVPGRDIFVAFSAERIGPGHASASPEDAPRVVGGATEACLDRAAAVLGVFDGEVHRVPSLGTAEMTKLLENTFRAVDLTLVDELADICRTLDIDGRTTPRRTTPHRTTS